MTDSSIGLSVVLNKTRRVLSMNKMVTKVLAVTTGAAMFSGMLLSGVGAPAKQAEAATSGFNIMNPTYDNGTNVQIFKTSFGYGAYATDSNGEVYQIARTPYYMPGVGTDGRDTEYGDFVAAVEVDVTYVPGWGVTAQTYYDEADFATNITDDYKHFANKINLFNDPFTAAASLDDKGGAKTGYIFGFEFGDYNDKYVSFTTNTWNNSNSYIDSSTVGVWTGTKWPDFSAGLDFYVEDEDGDIMWYAPEVYANPVFEDANSFANSIALWGDENEDVLSRTREYWWGGEYVFPGQIIPDVDGDFEDEYGRSLGDWGSFSHEDVFWDYFYPYWD
jgi:hypothetical protein